MKIDSFLIEIRDGRIFFHSDSHKKLFSRFLEQFKGKYRLMIEPMKSTRSDEQNRYYWVYLGVIAKETGHDKDDIHEWAKGKFLSTGITKLFGDSVRVKKSTTGLTKGEFVEYLMNIEKETGVPLPDTSAYFGFSYHKRT